MKTLIHDTKCGGVISRKNLFCTKCGKRPPGGKVTLRSEPRKVQEVAQKFEPLGPEFYFSQHNRRNMPSNGRPRE